MKKIFNNKIFISLVLVFVIGLIFGIFFLFMVKDSQNDTIYKGIEEYIELINNNEVSLKSFVNSFTNHFFLINLIFISSFAFIFFPIIYIINFYKGFSIGFLISSLILNYKIRGLKYALVLLFPHEYIFILLMLIISLYSLINASKLFKLYKEDKSIRIKTLYNKFGMIYLITIILISVISVLEVFINYRLVNIIF